MGGRAALCRTVLSLLMLWVGGAGVVRLLQPLDSICIRHCVPANQTQISAIP